MKSNRSFRFFFRRVAPRRRPTVLLTVLFCAVCAAFRAAASDQTSVSNASATSDDSDVFSVDVSDWVGDGFPLIYRREKSALETVWRALGPDASSKIAPFATAVDFQLRRQGSRYRGRPLALRGRLLRAVFVPTSSENSAKNGANDAASERKPTGFYDLWILLDDSKRDPVRLLTRSAPKGFAPDAKLENATPYDRAVAYRRETVEALAVYYRTTAFDAGDDFYAAPTLIAFDFQCKNTVEADAPFRSKPSGLSFGAKIGIFALIIAFWALGRRLVRRRRGSVVPKKSKKTFDLPDSIEPFVVATFAAFLSFSSDATTRAQEPPDDEFWRVATGVDLETWRRQTSETRPRLDELDPSRRALSLTTLSLTPRVLAPSVLRDFFSIPRIGDFVATPPDERPTFDVQNPQTPIFLFCGTLRELAPIPLDALDAARLGAPLFRAVVALDAPNGAPNEDLVVYSTFAPKFDVDSNFFDAASFADDLKNDGLGERVAGVGLSFGRETVDGGASPVALSPRIGWFPLDSPLGRRGVDLSTFESVPIFPIQALETSADPRRKNAVARSLRWTADDRAPFYESLAATRRPAPQTSETAETASNSAGRSALNPLKSETETVVALFNRPETLRGAPVRLRGRVRRTNLILVDDPDVRAATGLDRYYQLYLFTNDSQGWPLVLCVPELPNGLAPGGGKDYRVEIEFSGFLYKTWAYRTTHSTDASDEKAAFSDEKADGKTETPDFSETNAVATRWARVPLLIGRVTKVEKPDASSPSNPFSSTVLFGAFAALALAWIALRRLVAARSRRNARRNATQS